MITADAQVEAACDAYRAVTGDRLALVDFNAMRAALEAAAQAAPAPTAAPGEYIDMVARLEGRVSDYRTGFASGFIEKDVVLCEQAAAVIRKLTAERDACLNMTPRGAEL